MKELIKDIKEMYRLGELKAFFKREAENLISPKKYITDMHTQILHSKALKCQSIGKYYEAEELLLKSLSKIENVFGRYDIIYANCLGDLIWLYKSYFERYEECETLARELVHITGEIYGENHPYYADSLKVLAEIYMELKMYEEAEDFFNNAIMIKVDFYNGYHESCISCILYIKFRPKYN